MATWSDLAAESRTAAFELFALGRLRTSISRAYFSLYAGAAGALVKSGLTMPTDREGPHHVSLPKLIVANLRSLSPGDRWKLSSFTRELYRLRCLADYRPSIDFDRDEARMILGLMTRAFRYLEKIR